jgi:CheY-like chemotaxis protein
MQTDAEVIIIDDSEFDMLILKKMLNHFNLVEQVKGFTSPVSALFHLRENPPEKPTLIFLDIMMPEMDGFKFIEVLFNDCSDAILKNITIHLISSTLDPKDIQRAQDEPRIISLIHKPVQSEDIIACFNVSGN